MTFERQQLVLEAVKTYAQILGGAALLLGLYFTWRNLRATEEGKITERFTRAVDQLGSDKIEQRVGGIYALERIASDSKKDHPSVIELVCTFIRHRKRSPDEIEPYRLPVGVPEGKSTEFLREVYKSAGWATSPPEDIAAAASVLRRNKVDLKKPHIIDLSYSDLRAINLEGGRFQKANFSGAYASEIVLERADLRGADLGSAKLKMAHLDNADLRGALIDNANFEWAHLRKADLRGVIVNPKSEYEFGFDSDPEMDKVVADSEAVNFQNADLRDANLAGVSLDNANLRSANLSTAIGLSFEQIERAFGNKKTQLPLGIKRPSKWEAED